MKYLLLVLFALLAYSVEAQKIISRKSKVTFFSDAAIEDITATTLKGSGIIDLSKNEFAFSIPIKEFEFEKSLMKEHFNEKYMESDKFPKATFVGKISGFDSNAATQQVNAVGKMTIHGVTRDVDLPATMKKSSTGYEVSSKFIVRLEDYKVAIPSLLFQNIAEQVEVTVEFSFVSQ
jgi:polyisoprenoid-binding protein YceI